ncbi:MAG TPA: aryl-sulfate sulfotransferase [Chthoniobacterales bacterium]
MHNTLLLIVATTVVPAFSHLVSADQAGETRITIAGQIAGPTPFICQLTLAASDTSVLNSIQFTIVPKGASVTRPLSATYSTSYLESRGFLDSHSGQINLPIFGLYANYANAVELSYFFDDGSSLKDSTVVSTADFIDPCGYTKPIVLQARTASTDLSYDYVLLKGACSAFSPAIIDSDGALRWVGTAGIASYVSTFFDSALYLAEGTKLYRIELDGTTSLLSDYINIGVVQFHHNIDYGKVGLVLDADTVPYLESLNMEVDGSGTVLKTWNLADIISAAMIAGGDDPSQFVSQRPDDWFHNNAVTYRKSDDSVLISSRENFVICLDYETNAIKWILGDPTKKWYQFASLRRYAIALAPNSLPPIGQHSVSITQDDNLLLMDNGFNSLFQDPAGNSRDYASPRKYLLDLESNVATEIWNYPRDQSFYSPFCSSVYEDAPLNYVVDYANIGGNAGDQFAEILGLSATGEKVFDYMYPTDGCETAYNSTPLHLEQLVFSTTAQAVNMSARGMVSGGENTIIGGFIVTGFDSKDVLLRAIGPSLSSSGISGALQNPVLTLYNSTGVAIATNNDWQADAAAAEIQALGLAPANPVESTTLQRLAPGAYTVTISGKDSASGIGLLEIYDLSRNSNSTMANISTRDLVGGQEKALITGFIIGDSAESTVVIRATGPSLTSSGVKDALSDPMFSVYDTSGAVVAGNDNWQDDPDASLIERVGLAPANAAESATTAHLLPGAYTVIASGVNDRTGIGLVEVYFLP